MTRRLAIDEEGVEAREAPPSGSGCDEANWARRRSAPTQDEKGK